MSDRWSDNTSHDRARHLVDANFSPTTIDVEQRQGGWLATTAPAGVGLEGLTTLHTSGSRGDEGDDIESTTRPVPKGTAGNGA